MLIEIKFYLKMIMREQQLDHKKEMKFEDVSKRLEACLKTQMLPLAHILLHFSSWWPAYAAAWAGSVFGILWSGHQGLQRQSARLMLTHNEKEVKKEKEHAITYLRDNLVI